MSYESAGPEKIVAMSVATLKHCDRITRAPCSSVSG